MSILDSSSSSHQYPLPAKYLSSIEGENGHVPVEILAQAKGKEAPNDTLPKFVARYTSNQCVGTLTKESHSGKLVTDWEKLVSDSGTKPKVVDMSPAVSAFMAVKDAEELVSKYRCYSSSTYRPMRPEHCAKISRFDLHPFEISCRPQARVNIGQRSKDIARNVCCAS
jgi:nucleosome binding factor SPN SPT16 subunit